jgi:endo-1,4-beta-xylanase
MGVGPVDMPPPATTPRPTPTEVEASAGSGGISPAPVGPTDGGSAGDANTGGSAQAGQNPGPAPIGGGGSGGASNMDGGAAGSGDGGETMAGGAGTDLPPGELPFFVGNITTRNSIDTDGFEYSTYWDQITPENAGKWGNVQSNASSAYNWETLDAIYDYAQQNGIIFKEHAFVWGSQQPGGSLDETAVRNWMREFCARYPETSMIDVVNEPPPHTTPSYVNAIGGGTNGDWAWIANSFKWARESCPNAILILNDYNTIEWRNDANNMISIVKAIQEAGAPIDAVGAQAHDLDNGSVSFATVQSLMQDVHDQTGLPLYITEMDISTDNDQRQLELYQQYFPFFRDAGFVEGITIWGWIYGKTWASAPQSGLIRDGAPRPAMTWLMEELGRPSP